MKKAACTGLLLITCMLCAAQQQNNVPPSRITFQQFVMQVERESGYKFFYRKEEVDTVSLVIEAMNKELHDVLAATLSKAGLSYSIFKSSIFVTTADRKMYTSLPEDFFGAIEGKGAAKTIYPDFESDEGKKVMNDAKTYVIGTSDGNATGPARISGTVVDASNGEVIIGASIVIEGTSNGVSTDGNGFYSLPLSKGKHTLRISSIGMKTATRQISVVGSGNFNIELAQEITPLKEVVVESDRDEAIKSLKLGTQKLDIKSMKQMPSVLGEVDVLKVVLTLPGVQSVGEGASGVNIRGGATNQNLILFNDAVVYNPTHLFGFFSAFNPDILKNVELYKSGVTAEFGGRLSSVLDVTSREGNIKKFSVSGGLSPITGRLMVEGPLKKNKTSFLLSGRSTYSNWILRQIDNKEFDKSTASFYDVNLIVNHKFNDKNSLQLSTYKTRDKFRLNSDTLYSYGETNGSLKLKHIFSDKLYGVFTGTFTDYNYEISTDEIPADAATMDFAIKQISGKSDFNYFIATGHTLTAGIQLTDYSIDPGTRTPTHPESLVQYKKIKREHGREIAAYIGDNLDITDKFSVYGGIRYSFYQYLGPRDVFVYAGEVSRTTQSITDTIVFTNSKPIATYHGAEPRLSLRYMLSKNSSVKLSYNRMRQNIQMLSNTTAIAPTDIWKLSDRYIKPQIGDQLSAGYYKAFGKGRFELSTETYLKSIRHALDYRDGAVLLLNDHIETDAVSARGKAYGLEVMLKKPTGKLNGWISYTYSRTFLKTQGAFENERVNNGRYYPANYDKPHAANFITNYKFNRRINLSFNVTYSTGRPITIPLGKYRVNGIERTFYSERNEYRIPDYFRTDVSINLEGNHKTKKLAHSSWTLAVFNLTGRANAYSVFFVTEGQEIKGYKLSVFARPIPTITYNFRL